MKFGLYMFPTDYSIDPVTLGCAAEERGFESLWFPEHTHIPSSRQSPFPFGPELPREYSHTLDPFVALAAVASTTRTLKLGTGICLVVERDPIVLAKVVASLDHLSGGRVLFGIGGGWNKEELENHGVPFERRWKVLRERTEAMKAIWSQEEASYDGEFVSFENVWSWPKPVQRPHPPVIMGGDSEYTLKRVVRYCDGWVPFPQSAAAIAGKMQRLNQLAAEAGRGPIPTSMFAAPSEADELKRLRDVGLARAIMFIPPAGRDVILKRLDNLSSKIREAA